MKPISQHTILILVANPVDILTHFARKLSGLPEAQVLGTGTSLDSARLRGILAQETKVAPSSIEAYVLGEHGDSQFVSLNLVSAPPFLFFSFLFSLSFKASLFLFLSQIQELKPQVQNKRNLRY